VRHGFANLNFENFQNLIAYSQSAAVKTSCISLKFQKNLYVRKNVKVKVTSKTQQITEFTILLFSVACQIASQVVYRKFHHKYAKFMWDFTFHVFIPGEKLRDRFSVTNNFP